MTPPAVLDGAAAAVDRSVARAGVHIRELDSAAATQRGSDLLQEVWRSAEPPVPANLLRAVQHSGGYVFGAYDEAGDMVGASMGLLARTGLHSHITGVVPHGQRRGLGLALKQHQRWWALEHGITTITWTCDPLVRRNVTFNVHALGASVVGYLPDHYGAMTDGVNKGDESDRLELVWDLLSEPAVAAAQGRLPLLDGSAGRLVQLPDDIEALRAADPVAALEWRRRVRSELQPALESGSRVLGLTADGALVLA
jgi:predicted GNAT superfamily acetyltransferase